MHTNKISKAIKDIQKAKKYRVVSIVEKLNITSQCYYKWLEKTDKEWNLDALLSLSKILDFKICIDKGEIEIMENKEFLDEELVQDVAYEKYIDYGDYSIVNLYTPNGNLGTDNKPDVLEKYAFLFSSEEDCKTMWFNEKPIKVYGLLNNKTNELINEELTVDIYPNEAESYYYFHLAKNKGYTEDNYEIVEEFKEEGYKLVKVGGLIDVESINGRNFNLIGYANDLKDFKCIPGFALLPMDKTTSKDFISFADNPNYLYGQVRALHKKMSKARFFDMNRIEIFEGDILVKKETTDDNDGYFNGGDAEINMYFKKYESVRIAKGFMFNIYDDYYYLNDLNLMEWEKVGNIED